MAAISECRSCHAPIVWGTTRKGTPMPLCADPAPGGNALLNEDGTIAVLGPLELAMHDREAQPLRLPHHADCPDRDMWSRR